MTWRRGSTDSQRSIDSHKISLSDCFSSSPFQIVSNPITYTNQSNSINFIQIFSNRCHFWSNFEIADLSLWRSKGYRKLFEFLDLKGGFFYSRWGDAPVHSLGAILLLRPSELVQFDNIGYVSVERKVDLWKQERLSHSLSLTFLFSFQYHPPFSHCPRDAGAKCGCDPRSSFDYDRTGFSCQREYDGMFGLNSSQIVFDYKKSHRLDEVNSPPPEDWLVP